MINLELIKAFNMKPMTIFISIYARSITTNFYIIKKP